MNIGELLGAGLLGGVGNAAKGAGDRLREEAKQKRDMALIDQEQVNAVALQTQADDAKMDQLKAQGLVTQAIDDNQFGNQSGLLAQRGDIDAAAAVVAQANKITNLVKGSELAQDLATVESILAQGVDANQAKLQQAQTKLEESIAKNAASVKAGVDADAVAQKVTTDATVVDKANTQADKTALKLAETQMKMAVYDTTTNKNVADALAAAQATTAAKLGETRMAELTANNLVAIEKIKVAKVGNTQAFYNMTTGTEQMYVYDSNGNWQPKAGTKAKTAAASKGSYTFEDVVIDGEKVTGYMKGDEFIVVGTPVDDDTKDSSSWDAEKVTKFANKQAWLQMGASLDKFGYPTGNVGPDERAKVAKQTASIVKLWKANKSLDLAGVMDDVFSGKTTGGSTSGSTSGSTGGSTGGSTDEAKDLSDGQRAIDAGNRTLKQVVDALKKKYLKIDTSGLTAKQ